MHRLSLIVFLGFVVNPAFSQNPHGEGLKMDCNTCHNPSGWDIDPSTLTFDHDTTAFSLTGQHQTVSCMECHETLVFDAVDAACVSCHTDVHAMSVGDDCIRCHSTENWLVDNIPELHEQNGFPLFGAHDMITCVACHQAGSNLQWTRIGNECADCHMSDFNGTTNPSHIEAGFSTGCISCHLPTEDTWSGDNFHFFFPLTLGHDIADCKSCHTTEIYTDLSSDCISCHETDYNGTQTPDHHSLGFSTDCYLCHNTNPGWRPAGYRNHDSDFFPIYSGEHRGEWSSCFECHTNEGDYSFFSCVECHEHSQSRMDREHDDVRNYTFNSNACYDCHPRGDD